MQSRDVVGGNVEKIAALFPQCVTERLNKDGQPELAIDFDKLRAELSSDALEDGEERYQFTWPDKRAASRLANEPVNLTLRPCREESVDFDTTENLYIEGDNLDVLKVLRETYLGRVKMIYIDPPYNTGNDFVYNDDFAQGKDDFEQGSGLFDAEGNQTIDPMQRNTEANGRFHTDWLNMIYPRLKVARDLLAEDGVIFISIGDSELNNLQKIGNEIFGDSNFIAKLTIVTGANQAGEGVLIQKNVEYVLVYGKNILHSTINRVDKTEESWRNLNDAPTPLITRPDMGYTLYYNPSTEDIVPMMDYNKELLASNDEKMVYSDDKYLIGEGYIPIRPGKRNGNLHRWRWGLETFIQRKSEICIFKIKDNYIPKFRQAGYNPPKNIHHFSGGASDLKNIFGEKTPFDYPKGVSFLRYLVNIGSNNDGIILDFFSGSATTAHSVMKLNAEDGGRRKFIMVQLPEVTDEKSEAHKAGYANICEIGKERIRRAGKKVKEEAGQAADGLDTGFRVLKLDSSNMEDVFYTPDKFEPSLLDSLVDNIKADRSGEDMLFQVMLDLGIELSVGIRREAIGGKECWIVDEGYLIACFDKDVNETTIEEMAKLLPTHLVIRDASAANDNVLDNFDQIIESYSNEKKITTHIL